MDWNWFFSSAAQSIAALVGVLAAFLIASLASAQAEFRRQQSDIDRLTSRAERARDAAGIRFFDYFNGKQLDNLRIELEEVLRGGEARRTPEEYLTLLERDVPEYVPRDRVTAYVEEWILAFDELQKAERARRAREAQSRQLLGPMASLSIPDFSQIPNAQVAALTRTAAVQTYEREQEDILQCRVEVADCIRSARALHEILNSQAPSSSVVKWTIAATLLLFLGGVIYPLSFLPVSIPWDGRVSFAAIPPTVFSFRGLILALPAVVFSALLLWLHFLNRGLKHSSEVVDKVRKWSEWSSYSEHLAAWNRNQQDRLSREVA